MKRSKSTHQQAKYFRDLYLLDIRSIERNEIILSNVFIIIYLNYFVISTDLKYNNYYIRIKIQFSHYAKINVFGLSNLHKNTARLEIYFVFSANVCSTTQLSRLEFVDNFFLPKKCNKDEQAPALNPQCETTAKQITTGRLTSASNGRAF